MRYTVPGINWIWYHTDTKEEAEKWFEELTGAKPKYDWIIQAPVVRDSPGEYDDKWGFRIHK